MSRPNLLFTASKSDLKHLRWNFLVWHCSAKLKTPSWISRVPEPRPDKNHNVTDILFDFFWRPTDLPTFPVLYALLLCRSIKINIVIVNVGFLRTCIHEVIMDYQKSVDMHPHFLFRMCAFSPPRGLAAIKTLSTSKMSDVAGSSFYWSVWIKKMSQSSYQIFPFS